MLVIMAGRTFIEQLDKKESCWAGRKLRVDTVRNLISAKLEDPSIHNNVSITETG